MGGTIKLCYQDRQTAIEIIFTSWLKQSEVGALSTLNWFWMLNLTLLSCSDWWLQILTFTAIKAQPEDFFSCAPIWLQMTKVHQNKVKIFFKVKIFYLTTSRYYNGGGSILTNDNEGCQSLTWLSLHPGAGEGGDYKIIMLSFTNGDTLPDHDHD